MDYLRRVIFPSWTGRRSARAWTPSPATAVVDLPQEQHPLRPTHDREPTPMRPRLALPPILQQGANIPPRVGERAYYNPSSRGCMGWEINGTKTICHFSAPASFFPEPAAHFVGVVSSVDGVCHHVSDHRPFSATITDVNHQPAHG